MSPIVGVDFDNTVINYDDVMYNVALDAGLIAADVKKDKTGIRDQIRQLPDGEKKWQKIQAIVYGEAMDDAVLVDGVQQFFKACRQNNVTAYIISHKGEYAAADEKNINLRNTALQWMQKNKFFDEDGLGISPDHVYFESTRENKVNRIKERQCTDFIDDLPETFEESTFPEGVNKILFAAQDNRVAAKNIKTLKSWKDIYEHFFSQ